MSARVLTSSICVIAAAASVLAQPQVIPQPGGARAPRASTEQPKQPPPSTAVVVPRRVGQPVNVKVEFTLTDQRGGGPAVKRTLTIVVADAQTGSVRSQSDVMAVGAVPLNVDTSPELLADGKIRLGFNLQYDWPAPIDAADRTPPPRGTVIKTTMHDSVSLILESGKSMIAAQSADPIGDRQVTVEVKATILR